MGWFDQFSDKDRGTIGGGMGMLGGGLGGLLGGLFGGGGDPSKEANKYFDKMPAELRKYFDPYIGAGQRALPGLEDQFGKLINNPGGRLNEIGQGYQQSPGFQFALKQALGGAGNAAAAGGMAGSPQHEQQNMGIATGLANQDYNNWMQNALGMYGTGLQGQQGLYNTGANAGMRMGENMASILAQKAKLAYEGQNAQNQRSGGLFGAIGGGIGSLLPFLF
jgi:hypothetical protein